MINLQGKCVLVTGGNGFLGRHVMTKLIMRGASVGTFKSVNFDLIRLDDARLAVSKFQPDYVIHCAGFNGGIVYNRKYPSDIFFRNAQMALNVVQACREANVKKLVSVMTSCSYPDTGKEILHETEFYDGRPNESIECHGLAKRVLEAASRFANKQYAFPAYTTILTNLYGPGDSFDLEKTKVVGALVRKFVTAKQEKLSQVVCLGTGNPKREFMYVSDAAEALCRVLERYEDASLPLNIGTGTDVSIRELAETIAKIVGYDGEIVWDTSAGDGQMKKLLDVRRMEDLLDYRAETPLVEGLENTIEWYMKNKAKADKGR